VSRLHEAAAYAESQTAHGRVRFYIGLVMLAVLSLACAMVAVASILAEDLPEADQTVAVGLAGAVVSALLALWMVRIFSKRHKDVQQEDQVMNGDQWFALLLIGAVGLIGFGIWQISLGNTSNGTLMIVIAVVDVALVAALRRRARQRDNP
jgi:drug/metabolite transporter (DMT)-like permease